jgi:ribonuclease P protein component
VNVWQLLTAEGYWPPEEQKAERDYLFLTRSCTKHNTGCLFLLREARTGYFPKLRVQAMSKTYTFTKEERLCNKKLIDELFHKGSSFLCYPFKVSWLIVQTGQQFPAQVLFAVSKKRYKRAVDRNLIRRRMREAYRLNKQQNLYLSLSEAGKNIVFSVGYIGKEITGYDLIEKKMLKLLTELSAQATK